MFSECPVCKGKSLSMKQLEPHLHVNGCDQCGGVLISAEQYRQWLAHHGESLPEKPAEQGVQLVSGEAPGVKFCPQCKYVLMKYKVGHQTDFSLNRCGNCAGIWFDKNEWEILKSRNLHDRVHMVFSQAWQAAVRAEEHSAAMEGLWRNQLGEEDMAEIKRIKSWIEKHPKSAELFAYLLSGREEKVASR